MHPIRRFPQVILLFGILFSCLPATAGTMVQLAAPPLGERWFSITMGEERVGFAHTSIGALPGGYEVSSDGSARMEVLGFSRQASSRETYLVNRDLSLKSFVVELTVGGNPMRLVGEVTAKVVKVMVESAGARREIILKTRGKVYPSPVLNLYPLMQGVKDGKKYRLQMFDAEEVKLKDVTITALGKGTLPGAVATVHLRNDLYPVVDNDIWVDLAGNTVRESVRDGLILTSVENDAASREFIVEAAIAKKELIQDFSLVRIDRTIARPVELKRLAVEISGLPEDFPLPPAEGQSAVRLEGGRVLFTMDRSRSLPKDGPSARDVPANGKFLEPAGLTAADDEELIAKKNEIVGGENDPAKVVEKLTGWVAVNVAESPADDRSPLETLRMGKGNCQSHVRLYASLARAAGIPTRTVAGLVYQAGKGFAFHSWAESRVRGWLAVDPTFGQISADATHIKLAEADSPEAMSALAGIVGRIKAKVMEETY